MFSLGEWSPQLHAVLACTALLRCQVVSFGFRVRGYHPLRRIFPYPSASLWLFSLSPDPTTPSQVSPLRFGLLPFRSPLLWECFLFLRVLRCFSSPGSLSYTIYSCMNDRGPLCRVSPFGYPGIGARSQLPQAFRSVPRPSSAFSAKASSMSS